MSDLFALSAPWWHFILRAVAIYVMVMLLMRVSGKRAIGQFTPFDLVLLILIGNAVQNGLNGGDNSLTGALLLATCLIVLNYGVAFVNSRWPRAEHVIEGIPRVLARNGVLYQDVLRQELVSPDDFHEVMRLNNIASIDDVALALLETNGSISILSRQAIDEASQRKFEAVLPQRAFHRRHRRKRAPGHPDPT